MTANCTLNVRGLEIPLSLMLAAATLLGIVLQLAFNRYVLSRKDRNDEDQKRFENSKALLTESAASASDFEAAIGKALKKPTPSADDVLALMKAGGVYFATQHAMAQAILDGRVSKSSRDHDFVPKIVEALQKSLPTYYATLQKICGKVGIPFSGVFEEANYESMFKVADRHNPAAAADVRASMRKVAL